MTCRHGMNDPECTHGGRVKTEEQKREDIKKELIRQGWGKLPNTPDSQNYTIIDFQRIGEHVILKVEYPNCKKCSYEGKKVMVFLNVSEKQTMSWKEIDPHFRDEKDLSFTKAPSPDARFPASPQGWDDAIAYATLKNKKTEQE